MIFVDWFTPGFKAGGPIQSCRNFVDAFKDEFDLFVVTSDRDLGDSHPYANIEADRWLLFAAHVQVYYASPGKPALSAVRRLINEVMPHYIYLNSLFSLRFTIIPLLAVRRYRLAGSVVLAPRGMLQKGALQFKAFKKSFFIRLLNVLGIPGRLTFHATDGQESKDILHHFPSARKVFVAANFTAALNAPWQEVAKHAGRLRCVFLSRIAPKKNIGFLISLLKSTPPDRQVILDLYGGIEDEKYWEECKIKIGELPSSVSVSYQGAISNDRVADVYRIYHVFVLPTLGENFGHAIFEALACGKPVLLSDKTPWRNLESRQVGFDIPLDQPDAFGKAMLRFTDMDQKEYNAWSAASYNFARQYVKEGKVKDEYRKVFLA